MQRGGLDLNYANSDKILSLIGFDIDSSIQLLLSAPMPIGHIILQSDFDKYALTRNYKRIIHEAQNGEENVMPVIIHTRNPNSILPYMYIQPEINITYNYILLELLIKRLFVDLEEAESTLLVNTLNQFKKVYLIDVGNIGIKLHDIFNFLIMRCDRESIPGHDKNLYLFFDKNPETKYIEEENFELSFIRYIKIVKGFDDIRAQKYRNTIGKNMMMIRAFGTDKNNNVSTSNALDDFIFWLFAISINNIFDNNLNTKCDINNPLCVNTDLILISSDKQKINDPNGKKNLFTELASINNFVIYVNGIQNIFISMIVKFVSDKIVTSCVNSSCEPSKYKEDIGIKTAKSCLVDSYNNDDASVDHNRDNRFWLHNTTTNNDRIMLKNLKSVVESMNKQHPHPPLQDDCNLFEKFMTLIRYIQYIYFECTEKTTSTPQKIQKTQKNKPYYSSKHQVSTSLYKPKCAMDESKRRDFINDHY